MDTVLLVTATALGLLSYFEPCTIATHTLFAVRTHHEAPKQRALALTQLLLTRASLLALIFGGAAAVGLGPLSSGAAMLLLGGAGLVYLITRKVYLPVPHIEFFRLLPRHDTLSQGIKLGLTLPACTLPLVLIVGTLSALAREPAVAMLAGGAFALMFTLPTWWGSSHGLDSGARAFLGKAAAISPYATAALLWGAAAFIWWTGV